MFRIDLTHYGIFSIKVLIQEPVSALAWAGDGILAAVPGGYKLIQSGRKVDEIGIDVQDDWLAEG